MLEEIVHQCFTGFGDCVTGYVSAYLLKKQLEKRYFPKGIKLSIDWRCVKCPYINQEHLFSGRIHRRQGLHINCLYSGTDGTLAFNTYYRSPRMPFDLQRKTYLFLTINQYIGKCLIDEQTTRDTVKDMTLEAYQYFWNVVMNRPPMDRLRIKDTPLSLIYVRLGDQYLCDKNPAYESVLMERYKTLTQVKLKDHIALIGDLDHRHLSATYRKLYGSTPQLIEMSGSVAHSGGLSSDEAWHKIMTDLETLLYAQQVIILDNSSNFVRIVLFLKDVGTSEIYLLKENHLELVTDLSTLFAKHYTF